MNRVKNIVGESKGIKFKLVFDELKNIQACDTNAWRWFLWVAGEYIGNYKTKREAMRLLKT